MLSGFIIIVAIGFGKSSLTVLQCQIQAAESFRIFLASRLQVLYQPSPIPIISSPNSIDDGNPEFGSWFDRPGLRGCEFTIEIITSYRSHPIHISMINSKPRFRIGLSVVFSFPYPEL